MSKVFFSTGISLDGYMAGENRGPRNPLGEHGTDIHQWMFRQEAFLKHLHLQGGGETGPDNDLVANLFDRIGANIMGRRMFDEGEHNWPEEAPFGCPVFVITNSLREPWVRKGGTTFYFTDEKPEQVLEKAKAAANGKDVRISGGVNMIQQYLMAGLIDEFTIHIAPILLGSGIRLFDHLKKDSVKMEPTGVQHSKYVTHIHYTILK